MRGTYFYIIIHISACFLLVALAITILRMNMCMYLGYIYSNLPVNKTFVIWVWVESHKRSKWQAIYTCTCICQFENKSTFSFHIWKFCINQIHY